MKLEKFDYQIDNKKSKRKYIILGIVCLGLIISIALYRSFAIFTTNETYGVIGASISSDKKILVEDSSYVVYSDGTMKITGNQNVSNGDIIGVAFQKYLQNIKDSGVDTYHDVSIDTLLSKEIFSILSLYIRNCSVDNETIGNYLVTELGYDDAAKDQILNLKSVVSSDFKVDKIVIEGNVTEISANLFNMSAYPDFYNNVLFQNYLTSYPVYEISRIIVNANLTSVLDGAFTGLKVDELVIGSKFVNICNNAFASISETKKITFFKDVLTIGDGSFSSYNGEQLELPKNIKSIGNNAFASYVGNGVSLVIPDSVEYIGNSAFESFKGKSITFNNNVKQIGNKAFYSYEGEDISLPILVLDNVDLEKLNESMTFYSFKGNIKLKGDKNKYLSIIESEFYAPNANFIFEN